MLTDSERRLTEEFGTLMAGLDRADIRPSVRDAFSDLRRQLGDSVTSREISANQSVDQIR